jgi:hypothetical protein
VTDSGLNLGKLCQVRVTTNLDIGYHEIALDSRKTVIVNRGNFRCYPLGHRVPSGNHHPGVPRGSVDGVGLDRPLGTALVVLVVFLVVIVLCLGVLDDVCGSLDRLLAAAPGVGVTLRFQWSLHM